MKILCIYRITSKIKPERIYIGSAVDFNNRKNCHLSRLSKNKHHSPILQAHVNKYGIEDLLFEIIETICDKTDLIFKEQFYINKYSPYFNSCKVAGSLLGTKRNEEAKLKMRNAKLGKKRGPHSEQHKKRLSESNKGKHVNAEQIEWLRIFNTGKKQSEDCIKKRSLKRMGFRLNQKIKDKIGDSNRGKKRSDEIKKAISERQIGKKRPPFTDKHRKNMSIARKGVKLSKEHIEKLKISHLGKKHTEEQKIKISESLKKAYLLKKSA